jgi:hypothetical protein
MAYPRSGDFSCNYGEDAIVAPHVPENPPAPKAPRRGSLAEREIRMDRSVRLASELGPNFGPTWL